MEYRGKEEEEVFESDGVVEIERERGNVAQGLRQDVPPEIEVAISTEPLEVLGSFQYFHGSQRGKVDQWSLADRQEIRKGVETPWERFLRIQGELKDLQQDLSVFTEAEKQQKDTVWAYLQSETEKAISQSSDLQNHPSWAKFAASSKQSTVETQILGDLVTKLQNLQPPSSAVNNSRIEVPGEVLALEERIHRLEVLLGQQSNLGDLQQSVYPDHVVNQAAIGTSIPLIKVAQHLEERLAMLDAKTLDTIKAKSKLLRSDLEALTNPSNATKTASSTSASSSTLTASSAAAAANEIKIFEAAKKIDTLAEKVRQVESVADDLPVLVTRLKTLERVHWDATTVSQRLHLLETQTKDLGSMLQSNQEVLQAIKTGLQTNLTAVHENIAQVEARLEKQQRIEGL